MTTNDSDTSAYELPEPAVLSQEAMGELEAALDETVSGSDLNIRIGSLSPAHLCPQRTLASRFLSLSASYQERSFAFTFAASFG